MTMDFSHVIINKMTKYFLETKNNYIPEFSFFNMFLIDVYDDYL